MSGRGKELKGQTLVLPGSRSGASTIVTELAYDSAFNLEYIGEARYASPTIGLHWYIERLSYDAAFNLIRIQTAQNLRILGTTGTLTDMGNNTYQFPPGTLFFDLQVGDMINQKPITALSADGIFTLDRPLPADQLSLNELVATLENYVTKDFNKRAWDLRELYIYL